MVLTRPPLALLYGLFFLSGSAGLGYQIIWSKMFAVGLGHEMPAVLAVVCAFMGGMALGAWTLDRAVSRSSRPGQWYGWLEILIGGWGIASVALIRQVNLAVAHWIGLDPSPLRHWALAFTVPFVVLLPATGALGATFPAMERFVAPLVSGARCIGALYAANTLGAVAGTLLSTFLIVPATGLSQAAGLLAGVNILSGIVALRLQSRSRTERCRGETVANTASPGNVPPTRPDWLSRPRLGVTVFVTGLLGIGCETVGIRVLSQVLENTVYTFAAVLSVYLLGTAVGAALYQRAGRRFRPRLLLGDLLLGLSVTCLLGALALRWAQPIYDACRARLGDSAAGVLASEMVVAGIVFGLPTLFMGATFSHLVQAARRAEGGVGRAVAGNTCGGMLAALLFNVGLLPVIGSKWTVVSISLSYLLLLPGIFGWRWAFVAAPLGLTAFLPRDFHLVRVPPGGRLVDYREGIMASVAVVEDATRHLTLRLNNRFQMGGTGAAAAEYLQAHIPLLLHPAPRRALFLGAGTGITLGAASLYPGLESEGVELVPEVVNVMPRFEPHNFGPTRHPHLKVFTADARRFVRATDNRYDVIVADLFHPARDGAGSLYTLEHFRAIRQRLADGGLFCQWLPLHQLDEEMLRVIVRTFLEVFPDATAWLLRFNVDAPVIGLVGQLQPHRFSSRWIEPRLAHPELGEHLKKLALTDSVRFFGALLAGPAALRAFAGHGSLNTDDQPRVNFGAPHFTYRQSATAYGRLLVLLKLDGANPAETLLLSGDEPGRQFVRRLMDYLEARNVYLRGLIAEAEGRRDEAIDAFVESARRSADFTSGYAQCLTRASLQAQSNPEAARRLLQRLVEAQPSRPVAKEMLERLWGK